MYHDDPDDVMFAEPDFRQVPAAKANGATPVSPRVKQHGGRSDPSRDKFPLVAVYEAAYRSLVDTKNPGN